MSDQNISQTCFLLKCISLDTGPLVQYLFQIMLSCSSGRYLFSPIFQFIQQTSILTCILIVCKVGCVCFKSGEVSLALLGYDRRRSKLMCCVFNISDRDLITFETILFLISEVRTVLPLSSGISS